MTIVAKVYILIIIIICISFMIWFSKQIILHKRKRKNLNDFIEFNNSIVDWSKEIDDESLRGDFLRERLKIITTNQSEFHFNKEEEKQKIVKKWAKHIPSLLQELRNEKLNKLV